MSGQAMRRHLGSLGLYAQKIVRKKGTGYYVADFYVPEMAEAIPCAQSWAQHIQALLPGAEVIATQDTVADWRPGQPVIYATVVFRLCEEHAA